MDEETKKTVLRRHSHLENLVNKSPEDMTDSTMLVPLDKYTEK